MTDTPSPAQYSDFKADRHMTSQTHPRTTDREPLFFAGLLALVVAMLAVPIQWPTLSDIVAYDPDDSMRMVQVRDLLNGQGWWDLMQHRVNPVAGGVLMHWSRIVDAPIALLISMLTPIFGHSSAEIITTTAVPLLLFTALLLLGAKCYRQFSPRALAFVALALLASDIPIVVQFRPQHIDHHNWQILMAMGMFYMALQPASWRAGVLGGLFAGTYLAISLEGLPLVALFAGIAAVTWLGSNAVSDARRLSGFLVSLAVSAFVLQIVTRGPSAIFGEWCDSLSAPYLAAFGVAALGIVATLHASDRFRLNIVMRTALLGVSGVIAIALMVIITPACSKGPFVALDPIVQKYWYNLISEGMPVWKAEFLLGWLMVAPSILGLIGSALAFRKATDPEQRRLWAITIATILGALPVQLMVLRFGATAHVFAIPGIAALILALWHFARAQRSILPRFGLSLLAILPAPLFFETLPPITLTALFPAIDPAAAEGSPTIDETTQCMDTAGIAALNRLPQQTLFTPLDMAAGLLFRTQHSVVATGHHRNAIVMSKTIRAFIGTPAEAEALVRSVGGSMIVLCPNTNDISAFSKVSGDTLTHALLVNRAPAWLQPVDLGPGVTLKAWRVLPAAAPAR